MGIEVYLDLDLSSLDSLRLLLWYCLRSESNEIAYFRECLFLLESSELERDLDSFLCRL